LGGGSRKGWNDQGCSWIKPFEAPEISPVTEAAKRVGSGGAGWKLIARHNIDKKLFSSSALKTFLQDSENPASDAFMDIGAIKAESPTLKVNGKYKFRLVYDGKTTLIWKQSSWLTASTVTGFECLSPGDCGPSKQGSCTKFTGLHKSPQTKYTILDAVSNSKCWYQAVGVMRAYKGSIPAWNAGVAKTMELYIDEQEENWIQGKACSGNDCTSVATCPSGQTAVKCASDPPNSGNGLVPSKGACTAYGSGKSIKAIASCVANFGETFYSASSDKYEDNKELSASCPSGKPLGCYCQSKGAACSQTAFSPSGFACKQKIGKSTSGGGAKIVAVCVEPAYKGKDWFCVVNLHKQYVRGPFAYVEQAQEELNKSPGSGSNKQMICEMSKDGAKKDPHMVGGKNQGAGASGGFQKYWSGWKDVNTMNSRCTQNDACKFNGNIPKYEDTSAWFCVPRLSKKTVAGPFANVEDAIKELNSQKSSRSNYQMVCEMSAKGAKRDPHIVGGRNQGAQYYNDFQVYWGGWSGIHKMNAQCNADLSCKFNAARGSLEKPLIKGSLATNTSGVCAPCGQFFGKEVHAVQQPAISKLAQAVMDSGEEGLPAGTAKLVDNPDDGGVSGNPTIANGADAPAAGDAPPASRRRNTRRRAPTRRRTTRRRGGALLIEAHMPRTARRRRRRGASLIQKDDEKTKKMKKHSKRSRHNKMDDDLSMEMQMQMDGDRLEHANLKESDKALDDALARSLAVLDDVTPLPEADDCGAH